MPSVKNIGDNAFKNCKKLSEITMGAFNINIACNAFEKNQKINHLNIVTPLNQIKGEYLNLNIKKKERI